MSKRYKLHQWNSWSLWEQWVLATTIAEVAGLGIVGITTAVMNQLSNTNTHAVLLVVGILEGMVLGFAQWLVLRHYIRHSVRWIFATTVGTLFSWFIGITISIVMALIYANTSDSALTLAFMKGVILLGAGVGTILGFCQWLVLKTQIRFSGWWISANALAWSLGLLVSFVGAGMPKEDLSLQSALFTAATGAAMGATIGAITGIVLVWLLKPRRKHYR
jgi:hypothetical protein